MFPVAARACVLTTRARGAGATPCGSRDSAQKSRFFFVWTLLPFSCSVMRKSLFWASCLALFCISLPVASAQDYTGQLDEIIYALEGYAGVLQQLQGTGPGRSGLLGQQVGLTSNLWLQLHKAFVSNDWAHAQSIRVTVDNPSTYDDRWLKRYLTGRNDGAAESPPNFRYAGVASVATGITIQNLEDFLSRTIGQFFWRDNNPDFNSAFSHGSAETGATALGNRYNLFTVWLADAMRRNIATNQAAATSLKYIASRFAYMEQQEHYADNAKSSGESEGYTEAEANEDDATDDYESIDLPTASYDEPSEPENITDESGNGDFGLGDLADRDHSAIVTLVKPKRGGIVPAIEVDFGRQPELVSAVDSFADLTRWLYGVLFTLLLSIKGVVMFRKCRMATMAAAWLDKAEPNVSLAWNPL